MFKIIVTIILLLTYSLSNASVPFVCENDINADPDNSFEDVSYSLEALTNVAGSLNCLTPIELVLTYADLSKILETPSQIKKVESIFKNLIDLQEPYSGELLKKELTSMTEMALYYKHTLKNLSHPLRANSVKEQKIAEVLLEERVPLVKSINPLTEKEKLELSGTIDVIKFLKNPVGYCLQFNKECKEKKNKYKNRMAEYAQLNINYADVAFRTKIKKRPNSLQTRYLKDLSVVNEECLNFNIESLVTDKISNYEKALIAIEHATCINYSNYTPVKKIMNSIDNAKKESKGPSILSKKDINKNEKCVRSPETLKSKTEYLIGLKNEEYCTYTVYDFLSASYYLKYKSVIKTLSSKDAPEFISRDPYFLGLAVANYLLYEEFNKTSIKVPQLCQDLINLYTEGVCQNLSLAQKRKIMVENANTHPNFSSLLISNVALNSALRKK